MLDIPVMLGTVVTCTAVQIFKYRYARYRLQMYLQLHLTRSVQHVFRIPPPVQYTEYCRRNLITITCSSMPKYIVRASLASLLELKIYSTDTY